MMKFGYTIAAGLLCIAPFAKTQNLIPIPDTLSGTDIYLSIADSIQSFYPGYNTATIAYNGRYLGPTILLDQGQNVNLHVTNALADTTTTHWHGLHVAPMNDGSPHNPILAGDTWLPSFTVMDNAATYWYHPHLHGKTMDQVLKGAAGLIIVRDSVEAALALPRTYGVDDIPLICQFQTIDNNTKQILIDDELDNTTMVNGTVNPMVNVPAQVVRLRLLNASSHRVLQLGFNDGRTFHQITSDDGLLDAPVPLTRLRLGSGERAEILVDFSNQSGNTYYINQYGNELPAGYPGGPAMMGNPIGPLDNTTFNFLQINVVAQTSNPITTIPTALTTNTPWLSGGASTMNFLIQGSPMMSMTNFTINGTQYDENVINFTQHQDDIMIWNITNQSMMAHPFHIHGNHFFILTLDGATPPLNLQGRKDVVLVGPQGGSARLITKYADFSDPTMPYMYHCHILSHEDKGMMGQFLVTQAATGCCDGTPALDVVVYPNPAQHFVKVELMDPNQEIQKIEVMDMLGRLLEEIDGGTDKLEISTAKYQRGTYILKIHSESQCVSQKIQLF
jgi:blue copper oxidase